jgi:hypothetical protein
MQKEEKEWWFHFARKNNEQGLTIFDFGSE